MDPVDRDLDAYMDEALGSDAPDESSRDETEESEDDSHEGSFFGDSAPADEEDDEDESDDEDDDDSDDDDSSDDSEYEDDEGDDDEDGDDEDDDPDVPDPVAERLRVGESRLKDLAEAVQRKQAEAAADLRRAQTVSTLQQIKAQTTAEDWEKIEKKMLEGWQQHQANLQAKELEKRDVALAAFQMKERLTREAAEEQAGRDLAMQAVRDQLGSLSASEELALQNASPENFLSTRDRIRDARSKQTEPAREALRNKRQSKTADRAPLREKGGARSVRSDYGNYSPDQLDRYLDDVFATG